MSKVVLRVEPIKDFDALEAARRHSLRIEGPGKSAHIDQTRTHLNQVLAGDADPVVGVTRVRGQYKEARKGEGPVCAEMMLTAKAEWFDTKYTGWRQTPELLKPWVEAQQQFLVERYGERSLASVMLHLDEQAPHVHAFIVPINDRKYVSNLKNAGGATVTKPVISYGHYFTDTKAVLTTARRNGSTDDTKLGKLQTDYANAMNTFGLKRGRRKSIATHVKPGVYRADLARGLSASTNQLKKLVTSDCMLETIKAADVLAGKLSGKNEINAKRHADLVAMVRERGKFISTATSMALEVVRLQAENESLKKELEMSRESEDVAVKELRDGKEYLASLRVLDIHTVAKALGIDEAIKTTFIEKLGERKYNAVNFVMSSLGFDYKSAIVLMSEHFPDHAAAASASYVIEKTVAVIASVRSDDLEAPRSQRPLTAAEKLKGALIERMHDALKPDSYRITLMHETLPTINQGKARADGGDEQFYTVDDLKRLIPRMSAKNMDGYNILITPFSDDKRYVLIDDLTAETVLSVSSQFDLSYVQRSSPKSIQAMLVVPAATTSKAATNAFFRNINREFGDKKIIGLIHPFRLPGFTNQKPKHKQVGLFPFVEILQATGLVVCKRAEKAIITIDDTLGRDAAMTPLSKPLDHAGRMTSDTILSMKDGHLKYARQYQLMLDFWTEKLGSKELVDLSIIDYRIAQMVAEDGLDQGRAANVLKNVSPALPTRHVNRDAYVSKTVLRAYGVYGKGRAPAVEIIASEVAQDGGQDATADYGLIDNSF